MVKRKKLSYWAIAMASLAWLLVWSATQGIFMSQEFMSVIPGNLDTKAFLTTAYTAIVLVVALLLFKKIRQKALPRSKLLYLYTVPAFLLLILPFHYQLPLALPIYVAMVLVSVFWQDFLTFGVFQTFLMTKVKPSVAVLITALLFAVGHAIFYIDNSFQAVTTMVAMLVVGYFFASLRQRTGNIYAGNALHLSALFLIA